MSTSKEFLSFPEEEEEDKKEVKEVEELAIQQNPLFFRAKKGNSILWFLGSNHMVPFHVLHPKCQKIIKEAGCLAGEVGNEREGLSQCPDMWRLKEEPVWSRDLPKEFVDFCLRHLKTMKLQDLSFKALATIGGSTGLHADGMDTYIVDYFTKNEKPIYALDFDLEGIDLLVYGENIEWIEKCYDNIKSIIKSMKELNKNPHLHAETLAAYEKILIDYGKSLNSFIQDRFIKEWEALDVVCKQYSEGNVEWGEEDEDKLFAIVGERNYQWLPKILELHKRGPEPVVFVFGFVHLGGKYGILNLLRESGFKIERMNSEGEFKPFGAYNAEGTLAERLVLQKEVYDVFRSQVLDSSTNKPLSWMRKTYHEQVARGRWEQWKQVYDKAHENARNNEKNGYGAGAVVVCQKSP